MMKNKTKKVLYSILCLLLPTLIAAVIAFVLMKLRVSARVEVSLTVDRVVFKIGGAKPMILLNSARFQSIALENFTSIKLSPEKLEVADPKQYIKESGYPESAWQSISVNTSPVIITGKDAPVIKLQRAKTELETGTLDKIRVKPGSEVTLEVQDTNQTGLTIKIDGQRTLGNLLSLRDSFQMITQYCRVRGITDISYQGDFLTYRIKMPNYSPSIEFTGQKDSLVLILTIPPGKTTKLFPKGGIPVTVLNFFRQDVNTGKRLTTLKSGEITYPDYPKIGKVSLKATDFFQPDQLDKFRIEEISLKPEHKGIQLRLNGKARYIGAGSPEFPQNYGLTWFDILWYDKKLVFLVLIVGGVFTIAERLYKLYKEVVGQ